MRSLVPRIKSIYHVGCNSTTLTLTPHGLDARAGWPTEQHRYPACVRPFSKGLRIGNSCKFLNLRSDTKALAGLQHHDHPSARSRAASARHHDPDSVSHQRPPPARPPTSLIDYRAGPPECVSASSPASRSTTSCARLGGPLPVHGTDPGAVIDGLRHRRRARPGGARAAPRYFGLPIGGYYPPRSQRTGSPRPGTRTSGSTSGRLPPPWSRRWLPTGWSSFSGRHRREVGHRGAADEPDRRLRRKAEELDQPVGSHLLDHGGGRRPDVEPDVLVPGRGEPVCRERGGHRSADHEAEVARTAHRHQAAARRLSRARRSRRAGRCHGLARARRGGRGGRRQ